MYLFYSILLTVTFLLMSPVFIARREKYVAGFRQRLGNYPEFKKDSRKVIWLHCVSVGETNAARPLVDGLLSEFPDHRVIISTTTKTGQDHARRLFAGKVDAVFYFPFDWRFSVRRALAHFQPSVVLLMETEIWPRFIHEARRAGVKIAVVNGRLSERSRRRYSRVRRFIRRVLANVDKALMQGGADANRLISLGLSATRATVTGNIKFDIADHPRDAEIAAALNARFKLDGGRPLLIAASTHEPEERLVLDAFCSILAGDEKTKPRLIIAPRHPERFDDVARLVREFRDDPACEFPRYKFARRNAEPSDADPEADIILLDSIGELRAVYRFSRIAFVGGSLIPHGGQSILEPAANGNAIVTGPHTQNFSDAVQVFLGNNALVQLPESKMEVIPDELFTEISDLLEKPEKIDELGRNALAVIEANRGATAKTIDHLRELISAK